MLEAHPVRDRLHVWREIAWSHAKATVMTVYGFVCLLEFARDHWASDALKAKLHFVPNLTWQGWTIGALALLVIATLEGSYRAVQARDSSLDSERQAALAQTRASALISSLPGSDVSALYQANTLLKNEVAELRATSAQRHLDEDKQRYIAQVVRTGLRDLWELHRASASWTADDKEVPILVHLYTMENDRETIRYRADFAKAFQTGGLSVALGEFLGTSGDQENDQFVGTVSLVRGNPRNLVRPFILDALRSAGIMVNECDDWPRSLTKYSHSNADSSSGVTLIIGQRS